MERLDGAGSQEVPKEARSLTSRAACCQNTIRRVESPLCCSRSTGFDFMPDSRDESAVEANSESMAQYARRIGKCPTNLQTCASSSLLMQMRLLLLPLP